MNLNINNVINISVAQAGQGIGSYNTSNLALFTDEAPIVSFGSDLYRIYLDPSEVAVDFGSSSATYKMALGVFSQQPNILAGGGYLVVVPLLALETLGDAVNRTKGMVPYFGIMKNKVIGTEVELLADAAVIQAENKIAFFVSKTAADIEPAGKLDALTAGGFSHSRGIFYGGATDLSALIMMASYAGRGLSVNFSGSNTTITMHLKDLSGVQPDPSMTQTLLNKAIAAGVDTYVSVQGVAKTFCSGENVFFDDLYNLLWFAGALEVEGFNLLAQTSSKLPQTEQGVDLLKSAYRNVCEAAVSNQFIAAGKWTNPSTFGNQLDFYDNISQRGYYIYSKPVSQQLASDRAARVAPLIQIAIKYAGAIHSSTVIVNVNQ